MGQVSTTSLRPLQLLAFSSPGLEYDPVAISPRVFGNGAFLQATSSTTFVVPVGVTSLRIRVVGGGGGGQQSGGSGGRGGGGGGYAHGVFSVSPGASYALTVGAAGGVNASGGTTSFGALISATGGAGGSSGGAGGTGTGGTVQYTGGTGGPTGDGNNGGGGAGAASHLGNGGNGGAGNNGRRGGGVKSAGNSLFAGDAFFGLGINAAGTTSVLPDPVVFTARFNFDIFLGTQTTTASAECAQGAGGPATNVQPGTGGGACGATYSLPAQNGRGGGGGGGQYFVDLGCCGTLSWAASTGGAGFIVVEF